MGHAYAELHAHSNFSFLEGLRLRRELVLRACLPAGRRGSWGTRPWPSLTTMACTGRRSSRQRRASAWGIGPITGAEVTLASGPDGQAHHLTLLCETQRGYANLCRLLTHAHLPAVGGAQSGYAVPGPETKQVVPGKLAEVSPRHRGLAEPH